jgi:two-component system NtrC family sensor kinase/two-component system sensor histidine kinase AtoS
VSGLLNLPTYQPTNLPTNTLFSQTLLEKLNSDEKATLTNTLEQLINQTYVIEEEYKELKTSYDNLQNFLKQIVEAIPNAVWVFEDDKTIFLQNSEANGKEYLIELFDFEKETQEIEYEQSIFLVKVNNSFGKKIISATDITNERRNSRLVSMGQIAAHLSHEIRNPIGSVAILTSTLLKKADPKLKPIVTEIKNQSGELSVS